DGPAPEDDGTDLCRGDGLKEPKERDLEQVEKEVVIVVVLRVEYGQRQPFKGRQPVAGAETFPKQGAPANVVIAVPIAAADGGRSELEKAHHHQGGENRKDEINGTGRLFGLEILGPGLFGLGRGLHRSFGNGRLLL